MTYQHTDENKINNNIWLINPYCTPPEKETRLRTIKFAQYLQADGYKVKIFCGSAVHNSTFNYIRDDRDYLAEVYNGIQFVQIRNNNYEKNDQKRLKSLHQFYKLLSKIYYSFDKPDVILHTLTVPFGKVVADIAVKTKAKYFCEVLDLWPESFVAFGVLGKRNPALPVLRGVEKSFYFKADKLVFSMQGGSDYIKERGWDHCLHHKIDQSKVFHINNGVDLKDFNENKTKYRLEDKDLKDDTILKIIYLGSIRLANDLKKLVDAAALLQEYKNIRFLIYGDGDDRAYLENYVKEKQIKNIIFKEKWIDIKYVPYVLSKSYLNILNYMPNDIWRFGGSQSKLFQYLASGKPICSNLEMGYCLINKHQVGIAKKFLSVEEYAEAILTICMMDKTEYSKMCERASLLAMEYDYQALTRKFESLFIMEGYDG